MKTLEQFVTDSGLNHSLIRAVVAQARGWEDFTEAAPQVCEHGADSGYGGFIYHSETVAFAESNLADILDLAKDLAFELGGNTYSIIAGFSCLKDLKLSEGDVACAIHDPSHEDHVQVMNALAWFALEEVCRSYCDMVEA